MSKMPLNNITDYLKNDIAKENTLILLNSLNL